VMSVGAWMAAAPAVASRWKDRDIRIDATIADWPELTGVARNISVGAANDSLDLYLAIATSDPQQRRQLAITGLTLWLDPAGGRKETYGIRIPGAGLPSRPGRAGGPRPGAAGHEGASQPPDVPFQKITHVELLGPGKDDQRRLELAAVTAIAVAGDVANGTLAYEFRLPLARLAGESPYGIGATPDRPLGLGLRTPKLERPQMEPPGGGFGGAGRGFVGGSEGRGGFGGGRGGDDMEGIRGADPMQAIKELKVWTTVTLARDAR